MASLDAAATAEQCVSGESATAAQTEMTPKLHVDIPGDGKAPGSTQDIMSADDKTAVENPKDDPSKGPPHSQPPPVTPAKGDDANQTAEEEEAAKEESENKERKEREERHAWQEKRKKLPRRAAVRWSDYEHFKNRYGLEDGLEIIEVLYGHPELGGEIAQEKARRSSKRAFTSRTTPPGTNRWIQRVRIDSPVITLLLAHLTSCDGVINDWNPNNPRVFFRPFQTFYHTLPLMKKCVERLENPGIIGMNLGVTSDGTGGTPIIDSFHGTDIEAALFTLDPTIALPQMRVYIDFVEKNIVPLWDEAAGTSKQRVRWCDLPMLFRPGELLYTSHRLGTSTSTPTSKLAAQNKSNEGRAVQNVWRLLTTAATEMTDSEPSDWRDSKRFFDVEGYHVDFDGEKYGPFACEMSILEYSGEKDIRDLYVYPLRFEKDCKKIEAKLCERGKRFLPLVRERHCHYDGWSLLYHAWGEHPTDLAGNPIPSEYIDGEIIIDFKEGGRANPEMVGTLPGKIESDAFWWGDLLDPIDIKFWDSSSRVKSLWEVTDISQTDERFAKQQKRAVVKRDRLLKAHNEDDPWLKEYGTDLSSHFGEFYH
jgi:hypothetical protein